MIQLIEAREVKVGMTMPQGLVVGVLHTFGKTKVSWKGGDSQNFPDTQQVRITVPDDTPPPVDTTVSPA